MYLMFFILLYLPSDLQLKDSNYLEGTEKKYGRVFVTMFSFCNVSPCRNEVKNLISVTVLKHSS